jgi:transposase-like protein
VGTGDGSADLSGVVICPYCGEQSEVALDPGSGAHQAYVEDCPVCCQPWSVRVEYAGDGSARVEVSALE